MAYKRKLMTYKKKATKKPYRKKAVKKSTSFAKRVKRIVLKTCEQKRAPIAVTKLEVFHNLWVGQTYLLNAASTMPTIGSQQSGTRIGDQIEISGWKIRCLFGQKADRPNVSWRFMVFQVPKGGAIGYGDVMNSVTGNVLLDEPNRDTTKVLFTRVFRPNQSSLAAVGGREYTFIKKWFIPHKKTYKFGPAAGAQTHNQPDIYVVVSCIDAFGSVVTDNIGYMQMFTEMQYKDP